MKSRIQSLIDVNREMLERSPLQKLQPEQNVVTVVLPVPKPETTEKQQSSLGARKQRRPFSMRADVVKKTILRHFKKHLLEDFDALV